MGGRKSKRSLRIALFFVRAISKLLIAWEAGSCLEGTHPKATKAEFVITVRPCWTYAIYSTHFFMLAEIWNSTEQATRSLKMPCTEILNNKASICWKPHSTFDGKGNYLYHCDCIQCAFDVGTQRLASLRKVIQQQSSCPFVKVAKYIATVMIPMLWEPSINMAAFTIWGSYCYLLQQVT